MKNKKIFLFIKNYLIVSILLVSIQHIKAEDWRLPEEASYAFGYGQLPLFDRLYNNLTLKVNSILEHITIPSFSDVFDYGNNAYNAAKKIPSDITEKLNELPPNTQIAIIGILASTTLYGAYRYHKAYIQPTKELINESLTLIENLYKDPRYLYKEALEGQGIGTISAIIDQKEDLLMQALGLRESYLNMQSYVFSLKQQRKEIQDLCAVLKRLQGILTIGDVNNKSEKNDYYELIQNYCLTIYFYLLQALNVYQPDTLASYLNRINNDRNYVPYSTSQYSAENQSPIFKVYINIKKEINRLENLTQDMIITEATNRSKAIEGSKQQALSTIYGGTMWRTLTSLAGLTNKEQEAITTLFETIKNAYTKEKITIAHEQSLIVLTIIANKLSNTEQWLLVEDYLQYKKLKTVDDYSTSRSSAGEITPSKGSVISSLQNIFSYFMNKKEVS